MARTSRSACFRSDPNGMGPDWSRWSRRTSSGSSRTFARLPKSGDHAVDGLARCHLLIGHSAGGKNPFAASPPRYPFPVVNA
jgi:hypothetical protein